MDTNKIVGICDICNKEVLTSDKSICGNEGIIHVSCIKKYGSTSLAKKAYEEIFKKAYTDEEEYSYGD